MNRKIKIAYIGGGSKQWGLISLQYFRYIRQAERMEESIEFASGR
jgi:hypothetical protein